jgi:hypothetical protein
VSWHRPTFSRNSIDVTLKRIPAPRAAAFAQDIDIAAQPDAGSAVWGGFFRLPADFPASQGNDGSAAMPHVMQRCDEEMQAGAVAV